MSPRRSRPFWHRVRDAIEAVGARRALTLAPLWGVRRTFVVLVRDLRDEPRPPVSQVPRPDVTWKPIEELGATELRQFEVWLPATEIARRRQERQRCDLAWVDGRLAHYRWEAAGPVYLPYLDAVFVAAPGDRVGTDAFTVPAFRRQGLHSWSTTRALHKAWEEQARRSISLAAVWHPGARRVVEVKARRHQVGMVGVWILGPLRWRFATGAASVSGHRLWLGPTPVTPGGARKERELRPSD